MKPSQVILVVVKIDPFAQRRETEFEVQRRLEAGGRKVATLHGANEGPGRDRAINAFPSGKDKVLIATTVLARGIDVVTVSMALHFDLPRDKTSSAGPYKLSPQYCTDEKARAPRLVDLLCS
ncbi:hypothetical protein HOY80DRAFT_960414 [Tuber brumale]|nr:hypothetical protein HOY80DRAFT_960414 [Tuber brumale]